MQIRFDDQVVAVSGGGGGFGRAICRRFAALGARVFTCDQNAMGLAETAAGTTIAAEVVDLADRAAAAGWIAGVERQAGGPVRVLVHNAGGTLRREFRAIEQASDADWDAIVAINLGAAFALCRATAAGMRAAGQGRIVTISSTAGLQASRTGIQAYTAAKHGAGRADQAARGGTRAAWDHGEQRGTGTAGEHAGKSARIGKGAAWKRAPRCCAASRWGGWVTPMTSPMACCSWRPTMRN